MTQTKELILKYLKPLTGLLFFSFIASYFANYLWFTDLFSHFLLQYILGAIIFAACALSLRSWPILIINIFVIIGCCLELSSLPIKKIEPINNAQEPFEILQYNKLVLNDNYEKIANWLINREYQAELVVLQEANEEALTIADELASLYPYQIREQREHAFGMIVLSKYPFIEKKRINFENIKYKNFGIEIKIKPNKFSEDLNVFLLHAIPPTNHLAWQQRNYELNRLKEEIIKKNTKNTVFAGDWNITPYSPFFKKLLEETGLKIPIGTWTVNTWPSFLNAIPFGLFQIPIDHILLSDNLRLIDINKYKSLGSDHHPISVEVTENI